MKRIIHIVFLLILGFLLGAYGLPLIRLLVAYHGSPQVTLVNLSGRDIRDISINLGTSSATMPDLKYGHSRTVFVRGLKGEASTHITWTDSNGTHTATADDYVEGSGWYHTNIAILEQAIAKVIYEIK